MIAYPGVKVAKNTGRPTKEEGDLGTKHVRVHADLAEMIAWVARLEGVKQASLLDPLIRPQVTARFEMLRKDIEAIKKLEAKHKGDKEG